jgi:hypothetical protein
MLNRLLPQLVDNTYPGYKLALWLFALLLFLKVLIGLNSVFNGYSVASSADGIPLDTYSPAAAQTVVSVFAIWGFSQLVFCSLGLLALTRYRSLIPLMFALFLVEHLGRKLILQFLPIVRTGAPPGFYVNLVLLALMVVGLALSLRGQNGLPARH